MFSKPSRAGAASGSDEPRLDGPRSQWSEALRLGRQALSVATVFSMAINILMLAVPLFALQVYDRVLTSRSLDTLAMLFVITVGALVCLSLLEAARGQLLARLASRMEWRWQRPLLASRVVALLPNGSKDNPHDGFRDMGTLRGFATGPALPAMLDIPWAPIFITMVFLVHPMLGWFTAGGVAVLIVLAFVTDRLTRGAMDRATQARQQAGQQIEAVTRNAEVVESMGLLSNLAGRIQQDSDVALREQMQADSRRISISAATRFVRLTLQAGILGMGAYLAILEEISAGGLIAASILSGRALAPIDMAIASWRSAVKAVQSYGRLKTIIETAPAWSQAMALPRPRGHVKAEGATVVYPGLEEPTLRSISFEIEPGTVLGVIGPSAAGKSTLARLLTGVIRPRFGAVRLDGAEISAWESEDRGRHIGFLPQSVELFPGTIAENIARFGKVETKAVVDAAKFVGAHEMILRLPKGYETRVGPGTESLSGGQRQWIGLARAVFGNPRLLVLDEPNSNLDSEGEAALIAALDRMREAEMAVVVIAHRANLLQRADQVMVLRQGRIERLGPRDEVMRALVARSNNGRTPVRKVVNHG